MENLRAIILTFFALSLFLGGCAVQNTRLETKRGIVQGKLIEDKRIRPKLVPEEYVIEPPDQLIVSVFGNPDLTRDVVVRPDGIITLDLIGDVPINGMKVSEAEKFIQDKLGEYLKEADVSIQVTSFASKNIYVFGRVGKPGPQPYTGNNTILNTIANAGMVQPGASIKNILVIRQDKVNPKVMAVNFKDLIQHGIAGEEIKLKANDIVMVTPDFLGATEEVISRFAAPLNATTQPISTLETWDDFFDLGIGAKNSTGSSSSNLTSSITASQITSTGK